MAAYENQVGNKRKFDSVEQPRSTGFSAPVNPVGTLGSANPVGTLGSAPKIYNSGQMPLNDTQMAKEKAQEMVNLLLMSKRARVNEETIVNGSSLHPSIPLQNPNNQSTAHISSAPQAGAGAGAGVGARPYGFQSRKIEVPVAKVGLIIGKGGQSIKYLQQQSGGARIQVIQDKDSTDPSCMTKQVELTGSLEQINRAQQLINDVIAQADAGGFTPVQHPGAEQVQIKVPNNKVGVVIGKGGETIRNLQTRSGARIQVIPLRLPLGDTSTERTVYMNGTKEQIQAAQEMINQVINSLNPGYGQQRYRAPQQQWGQPDYNGYQQQYMYQGFSQQTPSGYGNGWNQETPVPVQSGGYDSNYYGQQGESGGANVNYGYGQIQGGGYGQASSGYSQQGYWNGNDTSQQGTINAQPGNQQQVYHNPQVTAQPVEGHPSQGPSQQGYGQPVPPQQGYSQPGYA